MAFPSVKKGNKRGEVAKRPHPGVPLNKGVIADLITKHTGNLSMVADSIGTTRGIVRRVVDSDPSLQDLLKQSRERQIDELEKSVFERAIEEKDTTLQIFLLKTQGKSRGYDQDEAKNTAKDIATAAFDFIISKAPKT